MLKAMDIVRVTDWGCQYTRYSEWFETHIDDLETEWLIKYAYGNHRHCTERRCNDNIKYQVLYVDEYERVCLITHATDYSDYIFDVYLIGLNGVELYNNPSEMTIEEIEEVEE